MYSFERFTSSNDGKLKMQFAIAADVHRIHLSSLKNQCATHLALYFAIIVYDFASISTKISLLHGHLTILYSQFYFLSRLTK